MGQYDHREDSVHDEQALAAATATIAARGGRVRAVVVTNRNAAARYLLLFDATSGTVAGTIRAAFLIPATGQLTLGADVLGKAGLLMATGITYGVSTGSASYTGATSTEHDIFMRYL